MSDAAPFRLDSVTVYPSESAISGPDGKIHLEPRVADLAVFLGKRAREVVSRDELIDAIWQGYPGADQSLTNAAFKLRHAFEQVGASRDLLETVPKRGYRFTRPITSCDEPAGEPPRRAGLRTSVLVSLAAIALVIVIAVTAQLLPRNAMQAPPRLAVMSLTNLGADEQEAIAAGLSEDITTHLASIRDLAVISRTSMLQYAESKKEIPEIARELNADYVLEGSLRWQDGNADDPGRVRISMQLIRASDDTHVWAQLYDRPLSDVFTVQTEIARDVTREIGGLLVREGPAKHAPTENVNAYKNYLRGIQFTRRINPSREQIVRGYAALRRAVDLDPDFAAAWAELSNILGATDWRRGAFEPPEIDARQALDRAIELAPESPDTQIAIAMYYTGPYGPGYGEPGYLDKAFNASLQAVRARPNDARALTAMGLALRMRGEFEASAHLLEKAVSLSPNNIEMLEATRAAHTAMRHWQRAEELIDRAIALEPDAFVHWWMKAHNRLAATGSFGEARAVLERAPREIPRAYGSLALDIWAGKFEEVIAWAEDWRATLPGDVGSLTSQQIISVGYAAYAFVRAGRAQQGRELADMSRRWQLRWLEAEPDQPVALFSLARMEALLGNREAALETCRRAVEAAGSDVYTRGAVLEVQAGVAAHLGEHEMALDLLEQLYNAHYWGFPLNRHLLETVSFWDPLRDHPRFQALVRKAPIEETWNPHAASAEEILADLHARAGAPASQGT